MTLGRSLTMHRYTPLGPPRRRPASVWVARRRHERERGGAHDVRLLGDRPDDERDRGLRNGGRDRAGAPDVTLRRAVLGLGVLALLAGLVMVGLGLAVAGGLQLIVLGAVVL